MIEIENVVNKSCSQGIMKEESWRGGAFYIPLFWPVWAVLAVLRSRGGAFYVPYKLRELRETRVHRINQLSTIPLSLFLGF